MSQEPKSLTQQVNDLIWTSTSPQELNQMFEKTPSLLKAVYQSGWADTLLQMIDNCYSTEEIKTFFETEAKNCQEFAAYCSQTLYNKVYAKQLTPTI